MPDNTVPLKWKLPPSRETRLVSMKVDLGQNVRLVVLLRRFVVSSYRYGVLSCRIVVSSFRHVETTKRHVETTKRRYDMTKRHNGTMKRRNAVTKRRVEHFVQDLPSYVSLETCLVSLETSLVSLEKFLVSRECTASTNALPVGECTNGIIRSNGRTHGKRTDNKRLDKPFETSVERLNGCNIFRTVKSNG